MVRDVYGEKKVVIGHEMNATLSGDHRVIDGASAAEYLTTLRSLLENMMKNIHDSCVQYGAEESGHVNYLAGSNVAGFVKVADAMLAYGHG